MSFYLDASVIVATMTEVAATEAVDRFLSSAADAVIVSDFTAAEVSSALARLVRSRFLGPGDAHTLLRAFDAWRATATLGASLQRLDIRLADSFVRRFELSLRAPDAIHAAFCQRGGHHLVTLDTRLARAARTLGLEVTCPA